MDASDIPLAGRQEEVARLYHLLEDAADGNARLVLIAGEPGIGKSRLLAELADRAGTAGWLVLRGRAYESEGLPPYLPFTMALRDLVRGLSPDNLPGRLDMLIGAIAPIVPEFASKADDRASNTAINPEHERYRLFESVTELLLTLARRRSDDKRRSGLVLVLDDLQWADPPSLLLLQHLVRGMAGAPILVAGSYRTIELRQALPLTGILADLRPERLAERMRLTGLGWDGAAVLIAAISGTKPAAEVVGAILRQTEGNPFFIEEMVRHLQTEHRDLTDREAVASGWGIPEGVREVVGARLSRLSTTANRMLHVSAVLGDGFDYDLLHDASGIDSDGLLDALDEATAAGVLWEDNGRFHFRHELIRQSVLADLSLPRRQRMHLRAAQSLEARARLRSATDVPAIAMHYRLAGSTVDPETTIAAATRAANAAAARFAWEDAASHWSTVLELLSDGDDRRRCEALLTLGEMQQRAGDRVAARARLEEAARLARGLGACDLLARVALSYELGEESGGVVPEEARRLLEEARMALGDQDSALLARVLSRLAWLQLRPELLEARRDLSAEAVAVARRVGDEATLAHALCARHWGLTGPEALGERLAVSEEIIAVADACCDHELLLAGHLWRLVDLIESGATSAADREVEAYARLAEPLRQPYYGWYVPILRGMQALRDGRFVDAEHYAGEALQMGRRGQERLSRLHCAIQAMFAHDALGHLDEALMHARSIADEQPDLVPGQAILAYQLQRSGCTAEARAILETFAHDDFRLVTHDEDWLMVMALLGLTTAELGEQAPAARIYDLIRPHAHICPVIGNTAVWFGPVERPLGLLASVLGRYELAVAHLEAAAQIAARANARPLLASIEVDLASALIAIGTEPARRQAELLLEQAQIAAEEIGMPLLASSIDNTRARIARDAARPAHRPAHRPAGGRPDGLTEREVEVLRLIAAGYTNREIADALILSVRTVERHIAHIYAKTNARGRADATRYAIRHHLVPDAPPA